MYLSSGQNVELATCESRDTHTNEFGIDMAAMIMTSMSREMKMMRTLNLSSELYFCRPLATRFFRTVLMK